MGSLKDEMRGLREDQQPAEMKDDGECPGSSGGSAVPEGPQLNTSQESETQGGCQPQLHVNASRAEESKVDPKDQTGTFCNSGQQSQSIKGQTCMQTDDIPLTQQPEANKTTAHIDVTVSTMIPNDEDAVIQRENSKHKENQVVENENILAAVPSTPDPSDPRSPAPFGQHHMRTQVSLEVVQCCSAATSPMTPPEGGHSFFFPSSFGRSGAMATDTKDAELQVGQQVEFCSVATSPMTPKTPSTSAFPELIGRETVRKEEEVKKNEGQGESNQQDSFPAAKAESEITRDLELITSKEPTEVFSLSPESSTSCPAGDSKVTLEDASHQHKQQRMGSMDQDITILVTHHGNTEGEEGEQVESSFYIIEPELVKIEECEERGGNISDVKRGDGESKVSGEIVEPGQVEDTSNTNQPKTDAKPKNAEIKDACEEMKDVSVTKPPPVPESPAPFGCHSIRTQVSLEVVQCQSVATSPMTPPEGDHAFYFPSSVGSFGVVSAGTKDAEMQVGHQVEFRSVATAPMTPRTPIATTFPEIRKEASIELKIVEEDKVEEENEEDNEEEEEETDGKKMEAVEEEKTDESNCKEKGEEKGEEEGEEEGGEKVEEEGGEKGEEEGEEKGGENGEESDEEQGEEPVQEVSWDEKGMTWEVYGAVMEVAVLGSAIQKHLEKQVKKQKRQPSLPPPPPLNPAATPLVSEPTQGGSGLCKSRAVKRGERDGKVSRSRRNPLRLLMENMQQPHCCTRAHTNE